MFKTVNRQQAPQQVQVPAYQFLAQAQRFDRLTIQPLRYQGKS